MILLRTSRMTGVDLDPGALTARVRAGALWRDVAAPAGEHGLAALAGAAADVGVVDGAAAGLPAAARGARAEAPTPAIADHVVLRELSPDAIDALVAVVGPDADAPLVSVEIRHLGGALARPDPDHGALAALSGSYLAFALGVPSGPDMVASIEAGVRALPVAMRDWAAGTGYANFADQPARTRQLLGGDVADRLRRVRAVWDPDRLFLANHPVDMGDPPR